MSYLRRSFHDGSDDGGAGQLVAVDKEHVPSIQHAQSVHKPLLPTSHRTGQLTATVFHQRLCEGHDTVECARGEHGVELAAEVLVGIEETGVQTVNNQAQWTRVGVPLRIKSEMKQTLLYEKG